MVDLQQTKNRLKTTFIALGVLNLALLGVLFSPLVGSVQGRLQQLDQLRAQLQVKKRQVEPLSGLDKKVEVAAKQVDHFYQERIPAKDSAISERLGKIASDSGVELAQVKNTFGDPEPVGLSPVIVEANLSGDYLQLVRFINSLEREQLFFIVDSVDLGGEQGDTVKLRMKLRTFLRSS